MRRIVYGVTLGAEKMRVKPVLRSWMPVCFAMTFMSTVATAEVTYNFDSSNFSLLNVEADNGYSADVSAGLATLNKASGTGNGSVHLTTSASVSGDFVATVVATRTSLGTSNELGLSLDGIADIFFVGSGQINANILPSGNLSVHISNDFTTTVDFKIERIGDTITDSFDDGGGYSTLNTLTDPSLAAASNLSLFLFQEQGQTDAASGFFGTVPEPASAGVFGIAGFGLLCRRRRVTNFA